MLPACVQVVTAQEKGVLSFLCACSLGLGWAVCSRCGCWVMGKFRGPCGAQMRHQICTKVKLRREPLLLVSSGIVTSLHMRLQSSSPPD